MPTGGSSLRVLLALIGAAVPPLIAFAIAVALAQDVIAEIGLGSSLAIAVGVAVVWAFAVGVVTTRAMADERDRMVKLAERGVAGLADRDDAGRADAMSEAQRRMAASLEERNRQIAALLELVRSAPITEDALSVAITMVRGAREITGDPTWTLAVLRNQEAKELPIGVYATDRTTLPEQVGDVHRWAATVEDTDAGVPGARLAHGPWGSFTVVDVSARDEMSAVLLAPWEGRQAPSPADLRLFSLLGQQVATAIEHALLYGRLRRQADELNRMAAVQSDFLRGISHDLQTPLTSIGALADELRHGDAVGGAAREDLDIIVRQADRLRRMVAQLLTVSRLEAGALTPRQEVFLPAPILERTWEALHATEHRLVVTRGGPPHLVVGDPDRLEQVVWALLDNAVKYSPSGGVLHALVTTRDEPDQPGRLTSVISIRDEGPGMAPSTASHAFDQFYRGPDARRLAPDGSGIGLYAARGLIEAMGGEVELRSQLGKGTEVVLTLPAEPATEMDEVLAD